jgi:heme-degrading monooxygenase HmoA
MIARASWSLPSLGWRALGVCAGVCLACSPDSGGHSPQVGAPAAAPEPRIARVWHGRTPNAKADEYAQYLAESIAKFPAIPGNLGYQALRETVGAETHFTVISYWQSRDAIRAYAGDDIRQTRHAPRDPEFLIDAEPTVMNYDILVNAVPWAQ